MTERLNVFLNGRQAGTLDWESSFDTFSFRYALDYLNAKDAVAISWSLPLGDTAFGPLESQRRCARQELFDPACRNSVNACPAL